MYLVSLGCRYTQGEIYWLDEPKTEAPMVPPKMPESADTASMLYLWVSDYMFDSIGYQAQKHGVLMYNLTQNDVSTFYRPPVNNVKIRMELLGRKNVILSRMSFRCFYQLFSVIYNGGKVLDTIFCTKR